MRYVAALFDAPIPANLALRALVDRGFAPADLMAVPALPEAPWSARADWSGLGGRDGWVGALADGASARHAGHRSQSPSLKQELVRLGLPAPAADAYAEGVHRGAILILVRCPTLSAGPAAKVLAACGPLDLRSAVRTWAASPDTRYVWGSVPPPVLETPGPQPER